MTWYTCDLSQLIERLESGGRPYGGASDDSGEIPSLGGENIRLSGGLDVEEVKKVPISFYNTMAKGILSHEDVLINKDGANTGKVGLYESQFPKAAINEHLFLLKGYPQKLEQRFLYYLLLSQNGQKIIRSKISGSAQPGLKRDFIKNFPVYLPLSTKEQSKIAEVLTTVDRLITQTETLIHKYQRIKAGLVHDLLTRGIDENGQLRHPSTHKFKPSPLGLIPEEWEVSNLEKASHRITSGSRWWAKFYSEDGAKFIRIGNLTREHVNLRLNDIQHVKPPDNSEAKRTALEYGDLLISITADLGIIGVVPDDLGEAYINQHIALVKLIKNEINPWWAGNLLAGSQARKLCSLLNDAGAKAGMNLKTVSTFPVLIPKRSEQDLTANIIQQVDSIIKLMKAERLKLSRLKSGLMQDLLTGEVSISPLLQN